MHALGDTFSGRIHGRLPTFSRERRVVLLVSRDYPAEGRVAGGIGVYTRELARALAELGEQVLVVTLGEGSNRVVWEEGPVPVLVTVPNDPLRVAGVLLFRGLFDDLLLTRRMFSVAKKLLRGHPRVVVDAPNWGAQSLFAGFGRRRWPAIVRVATHRDTVRETSREPVFARAVFESWLERYAVRRAERLVIFDESHLPVVRDRYRWTRPVAMIPLGLRDIPPPPPAQLPGPYLLSVGRIEPRKGVDDLLKGFRELAGRFSDLHLVLVGTEVRDPSTGTSYLRRWMERMPAETARRVVVYQNLPEETLQRLYAGAAAYVTMARAESFGLTISEAMRAGVPSVVSDLPAFRRRVIQGVTGYRVPEGDTDALVAATSRLLENPGLRSNLGSAARQLFLRGFTSEVMACRSQRLYDGLESPRRLGPIRLHRELAPEAGTWVLDLESGPRCLASRWPGWRAIAVDRNVARAHAARRTCAVAVCADAGRLPFRSESLQRVMVLELLEHVHRPADVLAECRRVLRPTGGLALAVPTAWSERLLHTLRPRTYLSGAGHQHIFHRSDVRRLLVRAGLTPFAHHRANGTWTLFWIVMALAGARPTDDGDAVGAPRLRKLLLAMAAFLDRRWLRPWIVPLLDGFLGKSLVVYAVPRSSSGAETPP